jgi:hypothetical protein
MRGRGDVEVEDKVVCVGGDYFSGMLFFAM